MSLVLSQMARYRYVLFDRQIYKSGGPSPRFPCFNLKLPRKKQRLKNKSPVCVSHPKYQ